MSGLEIDTVDQKDFGVFGSSLTVAGIRYTPRASPTVVSKFHKHLSNL